PPPRAASEPVWLARLRQVRHYDTRLADLLRQLVERGLVSRRQHKPGTRAMQTPCDVRADARRRAGEENGLASEVFHRQLEPVRPIPRPGAPGRRPLR